MEKRFYIALAAVFLFFGAGLFIDFGFQTGDHLKEYSQKIQENLIQREAELAQILKDTGFIYRSFRGIDRLPSVQQQQDLEQLRQLTAKSFNLAIYSGDTLLFWLNNKAFPQEDFIHLASQKTDSARLIRFPNGYFVVNTYSFDKKFMAVGLIPIKREFSQISRFLPSDFETDEYRIPADVYLDTISTAFPIRNSAGKILAGLGSTGPARDLQYLRFLFILYLLGILALGLAVNDAALLLVKRFQPWVGALFMFAAVLVVRWLAIKMELVNRFEEFETFKAIFTEPFVKGLNSLGELLISSVLLLWMMVFFNREFHVKDFQHPSLIIRFMLTLLNYFAIMLGMFMVSYIFKNIIVDSKTVFDFDNVFNLNSQSVLAMIGVVLLLVAFFLFSHRMMMSIYKIVIERKWRISALLISLLMVLPVLHFSSLGLSPVYFLLALVIYILMLEMFAEVKTVTVGWLVGWLILFSGLTAGLLYKYNSDKDLNRRTEYARQLSVFKDTLAEKSLKILGNNLSSTEIKEEMGFLAQQFKVGRIPVEMIKQLMETRFSSNKYLFHNYKFSVAGLFNVKGESALVEPEKRYAEVLALYDKGETIDNSLRFLPADTRSPGYVMQLEFPGADTLVLFLNFTRSFSSPSKVYTELLLEKKYKNLQELDEYEFGIYQDKVLIEERNGSFSKVLSDSLPPLLSARIIMHTSKRSELLYHGDGGIAVVIGRDLGGYLKPISLFSYVFTLLAIAIIFFSVLNYFTNALPGSLNFLRTMRISLRNQFQFWVIGAIMLSFVGIGFVTVLYFQRSSNNYHKDRLDRKVTSALANVEYEIRTWSTREQLDSVENPVRLFTELNVPIRAVGGKAALSRISSTAFTNLIRLISEVHLLDVNIYDLQGNLIASSEEDIFKNGLVAPKMGFLAYQQLNRLGYERSNQEESVGDLKYLAAYVPLKQPDGSTMAYMGIPYYLQQKELYKEVTDFMSTLLNVYIFLLLIAGGLAIYIANSITKAIGALGLSLKRLRLGYNEPIVWQRKDEIGDLVAAYNDALKKIEESSRLLAKTEREGAWREMAMQVAHEVKNPLTPMKLSIQYLQHAYRSDVPDKEGLVKRVSQTLIEQIEALTRIANEFSNFAKMPEAENSEFSLNQLVASVHGLFANERTDMEISLYMPDKNFIVFVDRGHLARVLNNLMKNAIQAIPDDRKGIVDIIVQPKETDPETVVIKVRDNGLGIPPDIQSKVFTPNFSTKSSGTGLGLAISKNVIESAKGSIYFETKEGMGTTFFVELPLLKTEVVDLDN